MACSRQRETPGDQPLRPRQSPSEAFASSDWFCELAVCNDAFVVRAGAIPRLRVAGVVCSMVAGPADGIGMSASDPALKVEAWLSYVCLFFTPGLPSY